MIEPIFTKQQIDSMRPHIQQTVDSLLDSMIKEGGAEPVDIVEKFALPVPSYVSLRPQKHTGLTDVPVDCQKPNRSSTAFSGCRCLIWGHLPNMQLFGAMGVPLLPKLQQPTSTSLARLSTLEASHDISVLTQLLHCRELLKYIGGLVDKRMEKPENDLISKLVTEQVSYKHNIFTFQLLYHLHH